MEKHGLRFDKYRTEVTEEIMGQTDNPFDQQWQKLGVGPRSFEPCICLGYEGDWVRIRFADGFEDLTKPHMLVPWKW